MKLVLALLMLASCAAANFAQTALVENDFEKNKSKYKLEKLAMGEDASSGYDYLVYKNKDEIVKVREIWSSSANPVYRIEDYFYKDGKLAVLVKYTFTKKFYKTSLKGTNVPAKIVEKLTLTDSKLTAWTENGKTIPTTDKRWKDKEKEVLEAGTSQLENYKFLKEDSN